MPGGDGTGPRGRGRRTGRGAGYCSGLETPGYMNPGVFGRRGLGIGRGRRYRPPRRLFFGRRYRRYDPDDE